MGVIGRNSGYSQRSDGTPISVNAEYAESIGKFPKMLFISNYGLTKIAFDFFVDMRIIVTKEWHHVGKGFKETDYYEWADFDKFSYNEAVCDEGSFGDIYLSNKKNIDNLLKQKYDFKQKTKFNKTERLFVVPNFDDFAYSNWQSVLNNKYVDKYNEEQNAISKSADFGVDRFARKERHWDKESEWREKTIKEKVGKLLSIYNERYILPNKDIEDRNKKIYVENKYLYEEYLKQISTETNSLEFCYFSVLSLFIEDVHSIAEKIHYKTYLSMKNAVSLEIDKNVDKRYKELENEREKNLKKYNKWLKEQIDNGSIKSETRIDEQTKKSYGDLFVVSLEEMYGKYGWFKASSNYRLPIYYSGYFFKDKRTYNTYMRYQSIIAEIDKEEIRNQFIQENKDIEGFMYFPSKEELKNAEKINDNVVFAEFSLSLDSFGILMF